MVLTEYDEKGYIEYEKKLSHEEGLADGEIRKLVQMICKKLSKGKSPAQIAEDLDEELDTVTQICNAAEDFAPDYDCDKVFASIKGDEEQDDDILYYP